MMLSLLEVDAVACCFCLWLLPPRSLSAGFQRGRGPQCTRPLNIASLGSSMRVCCSWRTYLKLFEQIKTEYKKMNIERACSYQNSFIHILCKFCNHLRVHIFRFLVYQTPQNTSYFIYYKLLKLFRSWGKVDSTCCSSSRSSSYHCVPIASTNCICGFGSWRYTCCIRFRVFKHTKHVI
jgi:hypothetical protein